jgi:hypothetical protein
LPAKIARLYGTEAEVAQHDLVLASEDRPLVRGDAKLGAVDEYRRAGRDGGDLENAARQTGVLEHRAPHHVNQAIRGLLARAVGAVLGDARAHGADFDVEDLDVHVPVAVLLAGRHLHLHAVAQHDLPVEDAADALEAALGMTALERRLAGYSAIDVAGRDEIKVLLAQRLFDGGAQLGLIRRLQRPLDQGIEDERVARPRQAWRTQHKSTDKQCA